MGGDVIVLKFGGSVLSEPSDMPAAVHEIYRWYRQGWRVVAVISSIGEPMLGAALERAGVPARVIDTCRPDLPTPAVHAEQLQTLLEYIPVLVITGFGFAPDRRPQALDPSGSDHWAVHIAHALRASRCRLLKDVDGIYEADPTGSGASISLQRFSALGYADALELATTPIQPQALRLLDRYAARAEVASIASPYESVIGRFDRTPAQPATLPPTSVLLLGLGELGSSIYKRIVAMSEHFRVVGAITSNGTKHSGAVPDTVPLLASSDDTTHLHPDVVIDTLPGLEPSHFLIARFLELGISIVSANLTLIADAGRSFSKLAACHQAYLRYNAAVGGSAPMLETLRREIHHNDIHSIAAVFSGEASLILDRCSKGFGFDELLLNATAEVGAANMHEELSGANSVRKLRVLARHAFGRGPDALRVEQLNAETLARAQDSLTENCTLRLVARAWKISHRVFGQLQLEALDTRDPLAQVQTEWNRLLINHCDGRQVTVQGRGGLWPTAEALMADLLDVRFAHLALSKPAARPAL